MTRYLTGLGYANTAPLLGEVVRVSPEGDRSTLIIIQGAIRNQGDAMCQAGVKACSSAWDGEQCRAFRLMFRQEPTTCALP